MLRLFGGVARPSATRHAGNGVQVAIAALVIRS